MNFKGIVLDIAKNGWVLAYVNHAGIWERRVFLKWDEVIDFLNLLHNDLQTGVQIELDKRKSSRKGFHDVDKFYEEDKE